MVGRKMLDYDEGEIPILRHVVEKIMNGLQSTGRGADCYDIMFLGRRHNEVGVAKAVEESSYKLAVPDSFHVRHLAALEKFRP